MDDVNDESDSGGQSDEWGDETLDEDGTSTVESDDSVEDADFDASPDPELKENLDDN